MTLWTFRIILFLYCNCGPRSIHSENSIRCLVVALRNCPVIRFASHMAAARGHTIVRTWSRSSGSSFKRVPALYSSDSCPAQKFLLCSQIFLDGNFSVSVSIKFYHFQIVRSLIRLGKITSPARKCKTTSDTSRRVKSLAEKIDLPNGHHDGTWKSCFAARVILNLRTSSHTRICRIQLLLRSAGSMSSAPVYA